MALWVEGPASQDLAGTQGIAAVERDQLCSSANQDTGVEGREADASRWTQRHTVTSDA